MEGGDGVFYAFLAVNNQIICRTELSNDLTIAADRFLGQLPQAETYTRYVFPYGGYNFHFAVEKLATYGVLSKDDVNDEAISLLLGKIRSDYLADALDSSKMKEHLDRSNEPAKEFLHKLEKAIVSCTATDLEDAVNLGGGTGFTVRKDLIVADEKTLSTIMDITDLISMLRDQLSVIDTVVKPDTLQHLDHVILDINATKEELLNRLTIEGAASTQKVAKKRGGALLGGTKRYWLPHEKTFMLGLLNNNIGKDRRIEDPVDGFFVFWILQNDDEYGRKINKHIELFKGIFTDSKLTSYIQVVLAMDI